MTLTQFKQLNKAKIFITVIKPDEVDLLLLDGSPDLKRYIFNNDDTKEILYHKMVNLELGRTFLQDNHYEKMDNDQIEKLLYDYADHLTLLEVMSEKGNVIIIDTDTLELKFWNDLLNPESYLYQNSGASTLAHAKIKDLLIGEPANDK